MPTVEELEISYRDSVSAGAAAATASLNKMADAIDRTGASADTVDTKITRTSKTATGWVNSLDNVTKSANALSKAQSDLAAMQDRLAKGVADGTVAQDQASRAIEAQQDKIQALTNRHAEFVEAAGKSTEATRAAGEAAKEAGGFMDSLAASFGVQTYQVRYAGDELHKFVDQVMAGGSPLKALAYQLPGISDNLGGLGNIAKVAGGFLMGPGGLAVGAAAVAASFAVMGTHAESQASQLAVLSQQLRATRSDYDAVASSAQKAAQAVAAQTTGVSLSDAKAAVATFDGVPTIDGTSTAQLAALTQEAANLATVLGTTVPDAAKQMAAAMADPEHAAEDFAQKGLLGVTEGLAQQVKAMQDSGDALGAWGLLNDQVSAKVQSAAHDALTPYQQAVEDLHKAMAGPIQDGKDFATTLGTYVVEGATKAVQAITGIVDALKELKGNWNGNDLSINTAGATPSVSSTISSVGASLGANADVIALAQRIAPVESSTGQYTSSGSVVTSSAGALGAMQVMPSSANGNDLTSLTGNVTAAEQLLIHLYTKYSGNQILVAMAYNWGEGNVDNYLSGKTSASAIPQETLDYTQKVTGGSAYSATTTAGMQSTVGSALRTTDSSFNGQVTAEAQAYSQLTTAQADLNKLHDAGSVSDADYATQTAALTDRMKQHMAVLLDLRDPMQQLAHNQDLAAQGAATYSAAEAAMVAVDQQVEDAAHKMGQAHASAADILAAEARQQAILTGQFNDAIATMDRQTNSQNKMIAGYDGTSGSLEAYIDAEKAAEKVRSTAVPDTAEYARQLSILTSHMDSARASAVDFATAQGLLGKQDSLQTVNAQIALLGTNSDDAARAMAALAEQQDLVRRYGSDAAVSASAMAQKEAALSDQIEVATLSYQHQKQALDDLASGLSSAFTTVGDDIAQAFVQGSASGVTFKSVLAAIETQVATLVIKLGVINPLMNSLFGTSSTTLGTAISALSGTSLSSGSSGGTSILGTLGSAGSLVSATSGGSSGILSSLGLSGVGSSISGILNTGLWGGTSTAGAIASSGSINAAYTTASGLGQTTVGSLLGGAGAGFAAGSILNSLVGGSSTGGTIGSGVGSLAGAAIGSIIPGVGTLIGGLIGGAGGGLLGGLFGGHKKNPYTIDTVDVSDGSLNLASSYNQAETDQYTAQLTADIASLNATFKTLGLSASTTTGSSTLGLVGDGAGNVVSSIASMLNGIALSSSSSTFTKALDGSSFSTADYASVSAFETAITSLKTMADTVDALNVKVVAFNADAGTVTVGGSGSFSGYSAATASALDTALDGKTLSTSDLSTSISSIVTFVESTMPQLLQASTTSESSYQQSIDTLNTSYGNAITQAEALGISTDGLSDKLAGLKASMQAAAQTTLDYQTAAIQARDYTAMDTLSGNTADDSAALLSQHVAAEQERTAFDQSWQAIYGDAYTQAVGYGEASALLAKTQADEQLAIQKQAADAEAQLVEQVAALQKTALSGWAGAVESAYTAQASLSDDGTAAGKTTSLQYSENGALYAFDAQYQDQIDAFTKTFTDAYGDAITQTQGFAAALEQEETTLGLQRLAIVKDYTDQIAAVSDSAKSSVASVFSSLSSYVTGLATSSASPLSAADQYAAANDAYASDLAKAKAGDYTALSAIQGDASTLLSTSQTYNGSGTAYASDYTRVLQDIQSIATTSSDAVTQSALNATVATATDTLATNQQTLIKLTQSLLTEIQQSNLRKAA